MSCEGKTNAVAGRAARAGGIPRAAAKGANLSGRTALRLTPTVRAEAETKRYGRYTISPLATGCGVTLGNALRRTLLSSVKGAAVTSVKVDGLKHEFSTIPHVREDMTALILNLKGVRLKFKRDKPARLKLKVRGGAGGTRGALRRTTNGWVAHRAHELWSAVAAAADVELELAAPTGYGYSPSEERRGLAIGEMALDADFRPVRRANVTVARAGVSQTARLGQPFDRLSVELETDGSLSPEAALRQAAGVLAGHFSQLAGGDWQRGRAEPDFLYRRSLEGLGLQPRTQHALHRAGLNKVQEVLKRLRQDPRAVKKLKGLGKKSYADLLTCLAQQPLSDGDRAVVAHLRGGR